MSWVLALDENVWINAAMQKNEQDKPDQAAYQMVLSIGWGGHKLAFTPELYAAWCRQNRSLGRFPLAPQYMTLFKNLTQSRYVLVLDNLMSAEETKRILDKHKENDLEVSISASSAPNELGIKSLVSTDVPLKLDLVTWKITEKYSFVCSLTARVF